jgi:hypothetical protein
MLALTIIAILVIQYNRKSKAQATSTNQEPKPQQPSLAAIAPADDFPSVEKVAYPPTVAATTPVEAAAPIANNKESGQQIVYGYSSSPSLKESSRKVDGAEVAPFATHQFQVNKSSNLVSPTATPNAETQRIEADGSQGSPAQKKDR